MANNGNTFTPADHKPVDLSKDALTQIQEAVAHVADVATATYFQSKLIQPDWRQITFTKATGYEINSRHAQPWSVQSVQLVNPNDFPVYIGNDGDPRDTGIAFPPGSTLRLPLAGNGGHFTVALATTDVDLSTTSVLVHLFRFPTVD